MKLIGNLTLNLIGVIILYYLLDFPEFMSREYLGVVLSSIIFNVAGCVLKM